jgi:excisionase family DNA binding protein
MDSASGRALLVRVEEAGDLLGIGRSTVYELIARGEIETVHIGRSCRVPVAALDEYVGRLREAPASEG